MINPFVTLAQKLSMLRHPDVAPTRILSLESMRKATVFVDNEDADADPARRELQQFFRLYGIEVRFLCPQKYELNWYGKMKKARPHKGEPPEDIDDDLFLSLAGPDNFAACYEARYSHAKFKVGIFPMEGNVYDLVIIGQKSDDVLSRQTVYIPTIKDILQKIK